MDKVAQDDRFCQMVELLNELETVLNELGEWSCDRPLDSAFLSCQPFCYDTMTLPQWLRFVFLPRMHQLIEQRLPLPERCGITPMAKEFFSGRLVEAGPLFSVLEEIDISLGGLASN